MNSNEKKMIKMVNTAREKLGLVSLVPSEHLCDIAREHSKTQLSYKDIFHESPADGTKHGERMQRGGYLFKSSAENVSTAPTVKRSHVGLMNSPGHYKNIVGDWKKIGVGIVEDVDGQLYVTQLFANPVKIINTEKQLKTMKQSIAALRQKYRLHALQFPELSSIQNLALTENTSLDQVLSVAQNELDQFQITFNAVEAYAFNGSRNPYENELFAKINDPKLRGIAMNLSQNAKTGSITGIFVLVY